MKLSPGDLVWIVPAAKHIIRDENYASKAVVMREIPNDWYRVYMAWGDKTRIVDIPVEMLKLITRQEK